MQIFITRGEDSSGPYTLEQVQDYLSQGVLLPDDFAYHEGLEDWMPLEQLISKSVPLEDLPHPAQMTEESIPSKAEPVLAEVVRPSIQGKGKKKIVITMAACLLVVGVLGGAANFFLKNWRKILPF
ncbi:MAG: GYF domain-containing protein [Verrucomicrobiota bacterium]|nr:GYF domain-containing protein [Verrucomicrobiota bacterium]